MALEADPGPKILSPPPPIAPPEAKDYVAGWAAKDVLTSVLKPLKALDHDTLAHKLGSTAGSLSGETEGELADAQLAALRKIEETREAEAPGGGEAALRRLATPLDALLSTACDAAADLGQRLQMNHEFMGRLREDGVRYEMMQLDAKKAKMEHAAAFVGTTDSSNSNFRQNLDRQSASLMREMEILRRRRGIKSGNTQGGDNAFSGGVSSPTSPTPIVSTRLNSVDIGGLLQEEEAQQQAENGHGHNQDAAPLEAAGALVEAGGEAAATLKTVEFDEDAAEELLLPPPTS